MAASTAAGDGAQPGWSMDDDDDACNLRSLVGPIPELSTHPSAINHHYVAMNIITGRRSQEHGSAADIAGYAPTRRRDALEDLTIARLVALQRKGIVSTHVSWRDRVDIDIVRCPLIRKGLGGLRDGPFGRGIRGDGNASLKRKQ